jgi:hypothetical protein
VWSWRLPRTGGTPLLVPYGADQAVYLVIERFAGLGTVCRETEVEQTDLETVVADLMSGHSTTRPPSSPSTRLSIGRRTSRNISPSKFRPVAILKASPFRKIFGTSLAATPDLPASSRCGSSESVSWDQQFLDPIELPRRKPLVTLRDGALYITRLPRAEHDAEEWAGRVALLLVAKLDGPTMPGGLA